MEKYILTIDQGTTSTRAILFNLFRDYLASPRQKSIVIKMQRDEIMRNEIRKKKKFGNNINRAGAF